MFRLWTYVTYVFNILVCFGAAGGIFFVTVLKDIPDSNDHYSVLFGTLVLFASITNAYHNFLYLFRDQEFYPKDSLIGWSIAERQAELQERLARLASERNLERYR